MDQNQVIFWESVNFIFCPIDKEKHLKNSIIWLNNPAINKYMIIGILPLTKKVEEKYFESMADSETDAMLAIETKDGEHIGNVGIHKIDWISGTAEGGIFIGKKDLWGKGYATEIENAMLDYAFQGLGLRKISAKIFADNKASLRAAEKNGFVKEGVLKKHLWKNGKLHDLIILSIFSPIK